MAAASRRTSFFLILSSAADSNGASSSSIAATAASGFGRGLFAALAADKNAASGAGEMGAGAAGCGVKTGFSGASSCGSAVSSTRVRFGTTSGGSSRRSSSRFRGGSFLGSSSCSGTSACAECSGLTARMSGPSDASRPASCRCCLRLSSTKTSGRIGFFSDFSFRSCTGSGGSSTGRSNSEAFARRRSICCSTWSMCFCATWFTIRSAGSGCSRFGSSYSILGRFLIAVMIPLTVILRLVISSSASAASSTITAPMRLMMSSSVCARSPDTTPAQLPSRPPSQSSENMSIDHSAPSCPPTSCTSAPMVTANKKLHVTRSATGLPSCSSRIKNPITNENGSM